MINSYYVAGIPYSNTLAHHGIMGQKWGIRRYQNKDGSLTAEGLIRYGAKNQKQGQRLMKYSEKEYARLKTGYDAEAAYNKKRRERLSQKKADADMNWNQKKSDRLASKISKLDARVKERKQITDRVLDNVKNMKVSDMKREQRLRGMAVAGTMASMMSGMYMANLLGFGFGTMYSPTGMVDSYRESRARKEIKNRKTNR